MNARELMTENPACCTPDDTVEQAARLMKENDCGCVPVVEDLESKKLLGTITDRDIACRCTAEGKGPETRVREAMSPDPSCCGPEDSVEDVERIMEERQVRRVPVIDDEGCCIGMVSQADLARGRRDEREVGEVVEKISAPSRGARDEADIGRRPESR